MLRLIQLCWRKQKMLNSYFGGVTFDSPIPPGHYHVRSIPSGSGGPIQFFEISRKIVPDNLKEELPVFKGYPNVIYMPNCCST